MKILGIESSGMVAGVAIVEDDILVAEYTVNYKKTHSQTLLPMLSEIVSMTETDLQTVDAIAVAAGPGSFTGLRIGAATVKGLGLALEKCVIEVPSCEAMAYNLCMNKGLIVPIMDARRSQVYCGIYTFEDELKIIMDQAAMGIDELVEHLNQIGQGYEQIIFLGDGVPVYREKIAEGMRIDYSFAPANMNRQRAASVATLGMEYLKKGKTVSADEMKPIYLRKSQAEREREQQKDI